MEAGNVNDFLDALTYQSVALIYKGKKYFSDGISMNSNNKFYLSFDLWSDKNDYIDNIFHCECNSVSECIKLFENAKIWDGLMFWEAEHKMKWIDW